MEGRRRTESPGSDARENNRQEEPAESANKLDRLCHVRGHVRGSVNLGSLHGERASHALCNWTGTRLPETMSQLAISCCSDSAPITSGDSGAIQRIWSIAKCWRVTLSRSHK